MSENGTFSFQCKFDPIKNPVTSLSYFATWYIDNEVMKSEDLTDGQSTFNLEEKEFGVISYGAVVRIVFSYTYSSHFDEP